MRQKKYFRKELSPRDESRVKFYLKLFKFYLKIFKLFLIFELYLKIFSFFSKNLTNLIRI